MIDTISKAKEDNWNICVYGLGLIGRNCEKEFLEYFGLSARYYCDKNETAIQSFPAEEKKKIRLNELLELREDVLVFVLLGVNAINSAVSQLKQNEYLHLVTYQQLVDCDEVIKKFFSLDGLPPIRKFVPCKKNNMDGLNSSKARVAVYTCITDGYDEYNAPLRVEDNCDYYLITDNATSGISNDYEHITVINISDVVPVYVDTPKHQNRYCKMHGYEIFSNYDYSVYLDGNLKIIGDINQLIGEVGEFGLLFHESLNAPDPYVEALILSVSQRIKREDANELIRHYVKKGVPRHIGYVEGGLIACKNDNLMAQKIMNEWYLNYSNSKVKRDQLHLAYTLFDLGVDVYDVMHRGQNNRNNGITISVAKHKGFQE